MRVSNPTAIEQKLATTSLVTFREAYKVAYEVQLRGSSPESVEPIAIDVQNPRDWSTWPSNWLVPAVQSEWFAHVLSQCARVLDVGAGPGRPSLFLSARIPEIIAIEPGETEFAKMQQAKERINAQNVELLRRSLFELELEDGSFDGLLFCYSLESTGNINAALERAQRLLKVGGSLAVALAPLADGERVFMGVTDDESSLPVACYTVTGSSPLSERRYWIYVDPESSPGRQIREAVSEGNRQDLKMPMLRDLVDMNSANIMRIDAFAVKGIEPKQLKVQLEQLGFCKVTFWQLPSESLFAEALQTEGVLRNISIEQRTSYVKALMRSSETSFPLAHYVSAAKAS